MVMLKQQTQDTFYDPEATYKPSETQTWKETTNYREAGQVQPQGPFGIEKPLMPTVGNDAHNGSTNNGFARKPCGGFYMH